MSEDGLPLSHWLSPPLGFISGGVLIRWLFKEEGFRY
jgi:hypothetical protein